MTMEHPPFEDVYPIKKIVDFPASHVSFQGCNAFQYAIFDSFASKDCVPRHMWCSCPSSVRNPSWPIISWEPKLNNFVDQKNGRDLLMYAYSG